MIRNVIRITTMLLFICIVSIKAQDRDKRGYVGISLGPSFLAGYDGSIDPGTGLTIGLLNFSYRIVDRFGISLVWSGGAHIWKADMPYFDGNGNPITVPMDYTLSYGTLMIGPMYSIKLSDDSSLEIKPRFGTFGMGVEMSSDVVNGTEEKSSLSYAFAMTYRKAFATHWCVTFSGDYCAGLNQSANLDDDWKVKPLTLQMGVGFQF